MTRQFERIERLLGQEGVQKLHDSHVLVVGLGGVGSYCLESLIRSGIGKLTIADFDTVDETNLNRQLQTLRENIGAKKTDIFIERAKAINPDVEIRAFEMFVNKETANSLFDTDYDYVADCIDSTEGKITLWKICQEKQIPFVASLGMANRLDPQKVIITKLNRTTGDPLAKNLRYLAKKEGLSLDIDVVFSSEQPIIVSQTKSALGSMMFVPASAGLTCGYQIVRGILERK
ncbi:MAG: tRNA threonylcarbamoyladenosine dehydratase [Erysipelotrichaceae bacterium]|nr:tRNA threonylcarbamoyladenosine dehydratase [Erysipelotrichaceae bacterium]